MINKISVDKMPREGCGGGASWRVVVAGLGLLGMGFSGAAQVGAAKVGTRGAAKVGARGAASSFFQGTCVYRVSAQSKVEDLNDRDIHKVLMVGDVLTVTMKDGNYKLSTEYADTYIIKSDRKEYIKFRKIDTVFYLDFDSDTADVTGIIKNNAVVSIGGHPCKGITIETSKLARQYFYSTQWYTDPEDDRHNTIGQADVYAHETDGALRLWIRTEYPYAT